MGQPYSILRPAHIIEGALHKCTAPFRSVSIKRSAYAFKEHADVFGLDGLSSKTKQWILDSGATSSCCRDLASFSNLRTHGDLPRVRVASGKFVPCAGIGDINITLRQTDGTTIPLRLHNVLYVPTLAFNLVSVKRMYHDSKISTLFSDGAKLFFPDGTDFRCTHRSNHYYLKADDDIFDDDDEHANIASHLINDDIIHARLGHCGDARIKRASSRSVGIDLSTYGGDRPLCEGCLKGRSRGQPHPKSKGGKTRFTYFGQRIQSDICGPFPVSVGGYEYLLCFIDAYSNYACIYPLFDKSSEEVLECCHAFVAEHSQLLRDGKVTEFFTDNGGEYLNGNIDDFCDEFVERRGFTTPFLPPQNALAERLWGILLGPMRAAFAASDVPFEFWHYCARHINELHNSLPSSSLPNFISPYECLFGDKPDLSKFRVWGCKCYFHLSDYDKRRLDNHKLDTTAVSAIHLGFDPSRVRAYLTYIPSLNRVTTGFNVKFNEAQFIDLRVEEQGRVMLRGAPVRSKTQRYIFSRRRAMGKSAADQPVDVRDRSGGRALHDDTLEDDDDGEEDDILPPPLPGANSAPSDDPRLTDQGRWRRNKCDSGPCTFPNGHAGPHSQYVFGDGDSALPSGRTRSRVVRVNSVDARRLQEENQSGSEICFTCNTFDDDLRWHVDLAEVSSIPIPRTHVEAMASEYAAEWKAAEEKEITSLLKHNTWVPGAGDGRRTTKSRWVYTIKYKRDGTIDRFKARFVACGYSQVEGKDYDETFAATMRASSFRTLLSVATIRKMVLEHMDVTSAFTQSDIDVKNLWVDPPPGYETYDSHGNVQPVNLKKALYGTKQASRLWNETVTKYLVSVGFIQSTSDPIIFVHPTSNIIIGIYVDDLIVGHRKDAEGMAAFNEFKRVFSEKFNATHSGQLEWFLGIAVDQTESKEGDFTTTIHQRKYIRDCLQKFFPNSEAHSFKHVLPAAKHKFDSLVGASTPEEKEYMKQIPYLQIVGSILYACVMTRPDCMYYISKLCTFMSNPSRACFEAAQGLLLYMGATENMGLRFGVQNKKLSKFFEKFDASIAANFGSHGFSDSSWGVPNPFAGHSIFLAGGPIAWQSRKIKAKLSITGDSSCETEYASAASIAKELNYLRNLAFDLGLEIKGAIIVGVDNDAAIKTSINEGVTKRNMHWERLIHYARQSVKLNRVKYIWVDTTSQMSDFLTKVVDPTAFRVNRDYHMVMI